MLSAMPRLPPAPGPRHDAHTDDGGAWPWVVVLVAVVALALAGLATVLPDVVRPAGDATAEAAADAAVEALLPEERGAFRVALDGDDLAQELSEALGAQGAAPDDLDVAVGADALTVEVVVDDAIVTATLHPEVVDEALVLRASEVDAEGLAVPGWVEGMVADQVEEALDLEAELAARGITLEAAEVHDDALVLEGTREEAAP